MNQPQNSSSKVTTETAPKTNQEKLVRKTTNEIILHDKIDQPIAFGFKTAWFAIKTTDTQAVLSTIDITDAKKANWETGQAKLYRNKQGVAAFITPPLNGWTLIQHDLNLAADTDKNIQYLNCLLEKLSSKFGEAQHFGSYRVVDYVSWYIARNGKIERSFSYAGGGEGFYLNTGSVTQEEYTLGFTDISGMSTDQLNGLTPLSEPGETVYWPDEEDPAKLAESWSVNPLKLNTVTLQKSSGYFGYIPDSPN